jgi:HEPN domain-containing protein
VSDDGKEWLTKFTADEWIRAAMTELRRAEAAFGQNDGRGGLAGCRRAAGMALNGALRAVPHDRWGRTYADHLNALKTDESAPEAVRVSAKALMDAQPPGAPLLTLRRPNENERLLEAARDVMAHGYALVKRTGAA